MANVYIDTEPTQNALMFICFKHTTNLKIFLNNPTAWENVREWLAHFSTSNTIYAYRLELSKYWLDKLYPQFFEMFVLEDMENSEIE